MVLPSCQPEYVLLSILPLPSLEVMPIVDAGYYKRMPVDKDAVMQDLHDRWVTACRSGNYTHLLRQYYHSLRPDSVSCLTRMLKRANARGRLLWPMVSMVSMQSMIRGSFVEEGGALSLAGRPQSSF